MTRHAGRRRSRQWGGALLETALFLPILITLFVGMTEIARITYTYYAIQRILYSLARVVGTGQAVNFCDDADPTVVAAKNFALTGAGDNDGSGNSTIVNGLTAAQIQVRLERFDATSQQLILCDCTQTGCDASTGGLAPDYIVVYLPGGFNVRPVIPGVPTDQFPLRPKVRVPYGGT